jgi:4'-phosphopantetheinyl transferase EntD
VIRQEQFEVCVLQEGRWEMLAAFPDFDVANALAQSRNTRVRLIRAEFTDGKQVAADVLAEIGATRSCY